MIIVVMLMMFFASPSRILMKRLSTLLTSLYHTRSWYLVLEELYISSCYKSNKYSSIIQLFAKKIIFLFCSPPEKTNISPHSFELFLAGCLTTIKRSARHNSSEDSAYSFKFSRPFIQLKGILTHSPCVYHLRNDSLQYEGLPI